MDDGALMVRHALARVPWDSTLVAFLGFLLGLGVGWHLPLPAPHSSTFVTPQTVSHTWSMASTPRRPSGRVVPLHSTLLGDPLPVPAGIPAGSAEEAPVALHHIDAFLQPIMEFLQCPTPEAWLATAVLPAHLPILLADHANCELKAAQTALLLLRKYALTEADAALLLEWIKPYEAAVYKQRGIAELPRRQDALVPPLHVAEGRPYGRDLIQRMVPLIQEELAHFEQAWDVMAALGVPYQHVGAAQYARGLMRHVRHSEPQALADKLVVGAFIEARSCERFARVAPRLPPTLTKFYTQLLRSESRHFRDYLSLAEMVLPAGEVAARVAFFAAVEADLIQRPDPEFRFHSGVPA